MTSSRAPGLRGAGLGVALMIVAASLAAQELPLVGAIEALRFDAGPGERLSLPADVAVGAEGRVYVVESGRHRIVRYDAMSNLLGYFGAEGDGDGELRGPLGIAVAPDGNVYVADRDNKRVQVFNADGKFDRSVDLKEDTGAVVPVDVAVSADGGTLFVTANNSHRVVAFDREGKPTGGWGGDGGDPGQFRYPGTVALDASGNVVVTDILNARVQVFDAAGVPKIQIGELGANPGDFIRPKGVAVDGAGRIYVSDSYIGLVQVFGADGEFVGVLSMRGEPVRFESPTGMAIAGDRLFVADMLAGRVVAYDLTGTP